LPNSPWGVFEGENQATESHTRESRGQGENWAVYEELDDDFKMERYIDAKTNVGRFHNQNAKVRKLKGLKMER
jgi:hypothetical protein